MKKLLIPLFITAGLLVSCSSPRVLTLMPRDSGKTYSGTMVSTGSGVGSTTIVIDQVTYIRSIVRVGSNETFGFATAFGSMTTDWQ